MGRVWAVRPWMSGEIALHEGSTRRRHAVTGLLMLSNPRRPDSSHVVSPQARGECGADLRNELVWMLQIVPADAYDVPALSLKVSLARALAGK